MPRTLDSAGYGLYLLGMSHVSIISKWPSLSDFAEDLGVKYGTAKAMRRRGSIPAEYWMVAVNRAADRNYSGVTLEALAAAIASDPAVSEVGADT